MGTWADVDAVEYHFPYEFDLTEVRPRLDELVLLR
jgi:hypothetical protein